MSEDLLIILGMAIIIAAVAIYWVLIDKHFPISLGSLLLTIVVIGVLWTGETLHIHDQDNRILLIVMALYAFITASYVKKRWRFRFK